MLTLVPAAMLYHELDAIHGARRGAMSQTFTQRGQRLVYAEFRVEA